MIELELLEVYEKNLKEGTERLLEVSQKKEPEVGQIREMWSVPMERFLVLDKVQEGLYLTVPMTSYLQVLPEDAPTYELRRHGLVLRVVPVWDYLREEIILNYSQVIGKVSPQEIERIKEYLKQEKELQWHTRRFIRLNSKRWAKWTMYSLLTHAEEQEEDRQVVKLPPETEKSLPREEKHEDLYIKGQNFFAVIERNVLRIYLPLEMVGEKVKIAIGDIVVFEGEVECPRIEIEGGFEGVRGEITVKEVQK